MLVALKEILSNETIKSFSDLVLAEVQFFKKDSLRRNVNPIFRDKWVSYRFWRSLADGWWTIIFAKMATKVFY